MMTEQERGPAMTEPRDPSRSLPTITGLSSAFPLEITSQGAPAATPAIKIRSAEPKGAARPPRRHESGHEPR